MHPNHRDRERGGRRRIWREEAKLEKREKAKMKELGYMKWERERGRREREREYSPHTA